ncbi:nucleoside hydrolase [Paenibacillus lycopersici]|uniref:Nucleoside hydrolase n=1 Tax=Paenibacillus lycopersici TaxID=2704462 RepID=A0A6C0FTT4_9BACL|nr:nucleoside hydrolase [Paenibacillus lycopersici]QHT59432.1 nucleoside hydrolase [Paenibacillus lycopersici]
MENHADIREKIIIDTDIGDDIDDALAIAFALNSPEVEVVGLTTVFGDTGARARIAASLLRTAGRTGIPVYAGCMQPINGPVHPCGAPCQYIADAMDRIEIPGKHAVDYLIETVMGAEEPVTVLAIGPLTNLAAALLKEPRLRQKLNRIVIMGGAYYFHFIEWNIHCDPEAANIVFRSGIPMTAVGLDVTKRCLMNAEQLARLERAETPLARLLWRLIRQWQRDTGRTYPILHDALAAYGVFGETHLRFEREAVAVEMAGKHTRGMTFNLTDRDREEQLVQAAVRAAEGSAVMAAADVDSEAFIALFLDRLLKGAEA